MAPKAKYGRNNSISDGQLHSGHIECAQWQCAQEADEQTRNKYFSEFQYAKFYDGTGKNRTAIYSGICANIFE